MSAVGQQHATAVIPDGAWTVDRAHSELGFAVANLWGLSTVRGSFARYSGSLTVHGPLISGELTVAADSLDTANRRRDRHLRSADFVDADRHPEIRYVVTHATPDAAELVLHGTLSIAGTSLTVRIAVAVLAAADGAVTLRGATAISRAAAGVEWNRLGMIGDEVAIDARLRLTRAPA